MQLSIEVKEPVVDGPLALYPLVSAGPSAPAYMCGPDAEATDVLVVDEIDERAAVSELVVQNRGDQPVLLIEGETVLGAKQNRTLNLTVLWRRRSLRRSRCRVSSRAGGEHHRPRRVRPATRQVRYVG